ncbi:MAG TPA: hypothetical protein VGX03_39480 [Candidatus Binatia bacterium]|nr:hypothetical protein [Candidatus Binatia bacterium]
MKNFDLATPRQRLPSPGAESGNVGEVVGQTRLGECFLNLGIAEISPYI